eukprot:104649-Pyramimonas_sp.AAC.1
MANIAIGGLWPRQRVAGETRARIDVESHARHSGAKAPFHCFWTCQCNKDAKTFVDSDYVVPRAHTLRESEAC